MYIHRGEGIGTSRPNWAMASSRFSSVMPTARPSPSSDRTVQLGLGEGSGGWVFQGRTLSLGPGCALECSTLPCTNVRQGFREHGVVFQYWG